MNNGTVFVSRRKKTTFYLRSGDTMDEKAVYGFAASLGYSLKPEQKRSIWKFLSGNDVNFIANTIWDILVLHHVVFVL